MQTSPAGAVGLDRVPVQGPGPSVVVGCVCPPPFVQVLTTTNTFPSWMRLLAAGLSVSSTPQSAPLLEPAGNCVSKSPPIAPRSTVPDVTAPADTSLVSTVPRTSRVVAPIANIFFIRSPSCSVAHLRQWTGKPSDPPLDLENDACPKPF